MSDKDKYDEDAEREYLNVHDRHCCKRHGCKYGDDNCSVAYGIDLGVKCESCSEDMDFADQLAAKDAEIERLKEEIEVGLSISGSFFEALKPLSLTMINVANPGSHVTSLITEITELKAKLADAEKRGAERAITVARNLKYSGDFETNYPTQYKKFMESRDNIYDLADALIEIVRAEIEKVKP